MEAKRNGVLYSLITTRLRYVEERNLTPEELATAMDFWERALAAIGINADPLELE